MAIIYRIEDERGAGAFGSGLVLRACYAAADQVSNYADPYRHPCPNTDPGMSEAWDSLAGRECYLFGFSSIGQLMQWFDDPAIRSAMRAFGGVMCTYQVDDCYVLHGTYQSVFRRDNARLMSRSDIPT
jgi:hypothetical protein